MEVICLRPGVIFRKMHGGGGADIQRTPGTIPSLGLIKGPSLAAQAWPQPSLHLLICCMHAVWHGWERLAWIADIVGLLVTYPGAYAQAHALAGRARFPRRALDAASALANRILGPLPGADAFFPAPAAGVENAFHTLAQAPFAHGFAAQRRFHHAMLGLPERIGYDFRRLLIPGDADFRRFSLPAAMPAAYWLLRPWRLLFCR